MALTQGKWVKLDQNGTNPGARSSHSITIVGDKVYAFGGEFTPRVPVDNKLYVFDLNDQTWSVVEATGDVPPPRVGVTMAATEGNQTIYVFGGRDATHKELNELYSFDTRTCTWSLISSGDNGGPPHRSYHSMTADDRCVYVFGGCGDAGRLNDLWAYDVVDKIWTKFPDPEQDKCKPRGGPGLVVSQGKIWVVYGFSGVEQDDVHYFDLAQKRWVQVETTGEKPTARSVFSCTVIGDYIVIFGGEIDPSDLGHLGAGQFAGDVYALNTETLEWKKWEDNGHDHPGPRGWCAFSSVKKDDSKKTGLLVYGGNSPSNDRLNDMYLFTP